MRSKNKFFSEFYYPDEIVTETEGNVAGSLYFARFACLKPYNKQLNNLVCSGFTVNEPRQEARSIKQEFHPACSLEF